MKSSDCIAIMHVGKVAALGTCKELEASLGVGHTLNDHGFGGSVHKVLMIKEM